MTVTERARAPAKRQLPVDIPGYSVTLVSRGTSLQYSRLQVVEHLKLDTQIRGEVVVQYAVARVLYCDVFSPSWSRFGS
jgi:hypothetical protein